MSKTNPEKGVNTYQPSLFSQVREKAGVSVEEVADKTGYTLRTVYRWESGATMPKKPIFEMLESLINNSMTSFNKSSSFDFIDLFAGIGGMRKGFEAANGKCVYTAEWNKYSRQTYQANFECDHEVAGDITGIAAEEIPSHDLLVAGFPCQPFSLAGVSKKNSLGREHGFRCDAQGTLFFDVARIIEHCRPSAFLLENVKNLKSHDKGKTFEIIKKTLEVELGYHIQYRVINAKSLLPTHRERIFIVGFREKTGFNFDELVFPSLSEGPKLSTILHPMNGSEEVEEPYTTTPRGRVADKYTLTPRLWEYLQAYKAKHQAAGNGFGYGLFGPDDVARTLSARYHKDGSEILIRQKSGMRPRRLTPRECSRLMGFDRFGGAGFQIPVSDTQAYRQFGNAVAVPVVERIAKHMRKHILSVKRGITSCS